jgi:plasmid stability protein
MLTIRLTPEQLQEVRVKAAQAGMSMEAYGRQQILETEPRRAVLRQDAKSVMMRGMSRETAHATIGNVKRIRDEKGNRLP